MKTAISIPDPLFKEAERLTKRLRIPRSQLYARALEDYIQRHNVPVHPLYAKGFPSIGCGPCTRAAFDCEDERAGRWWWEQDNAEKECGIHISPNGQVIRQVDALIAGIQPAAN